MSPTFTIHSSGAARPREIHLLPGLFDLDGVEPFVVARPADIVEVIVDAVAALTLRAGRRQPANLSPVVVREQQDDVVRDFHAAIVVVLHFLVERPDLRRSLGRLAGDCSDDATLVGDDGLERGSPCCPSSPRRRRRACRS